MLWSVLTALCTQESLLTWGEELTNTTAAKEQSTQDLVVLLS